MNKEARKALREAILAQLDDDMMPLAVGGHTITDQLVYAGCSQWSGCERDWDDVRSDYAWIVDGQWQLTFPKLDYFDGHNQLCRQSNYYLQPDRSESPPDGPVGEPLLRLPDEVLIEIGKGLASAIETHKQQQATEDGEATRIASVLAEAKA